MFIIFIVQLPLIFCPFMTDKCLQTGQVVPEHDLIDYSLSIPHK